MTTDQIKEKIDAILAEEFEVNPSRIVSDAPLMDTLDLDSLDMVDIVVLVDENFGVTLNSTDFKGVETFQDFYDLIFTKTNGAK